ncbi:ergothioneine biosynthesis protein EgtB [Nocardiopsis sp. EMB25]|uniref:ergothioneine biosynthesis protein EgtB n=1 Tax=Nocardiopsis sp. EMB25 TaxID=2835867 RepID=UPI00228339FF|nr:ergothioneine biosynthesis protein EgtB [Nocardiopsis sp. EMB25]MCY9782625.1 ergothioneine biosynthesis protein EgtB [Nocardiopsis sp. EMB25]
MNHEQERAKERIAVELERSRRRSNGLTLDALNDEGLIAQHSKLMSPLVWDLAHIGNYEEQWLLRAAGGREALRPDIDHLYDAFENPRAERVTLPLLTPDEAAEYNDRVRDEVLEVLDKADIAPAGIPRQREGSDGYRALLDAGFVFHMVIQHEHQHDETMLATHQLRKGEPVLLDGSGGVAALSPPTEAEVLVPAGPFTMGAADDPWAYDNERPAHTVDLPAYWIDTRPVTNAEYLGFMADGGYQTRHWWTREGWEWQRRRNAVSPAFWTREGQDWSRRRFGRHEMVPPEEPVQHVSFHEAQAYARWAGKRLPTEAEWEKAARFDPETGRSTRYPWGDDEPGIRHANLGQRRLGPSPAGRHPDGASPLGVQQLIGDVWEWTSTTFDGYPGFRAFPYREYSEVFFNEGYKVLRGGSWATHPTAVRSTFRNWDHPIRRQIFSGFRCARDAESD